VHEGLRDLCSSEAAPPVKLFASATKDMREYPGSASASPEKPPPLSPCGVQAAGVDTTSGPGSMPK